EQDVAVEPARLLRRDDVGGRLEVLDLGGDAHRELARVERLDPVDPAPARDRSLPCRGGVVPQRADRPEPGDRAASHPAKSMRADGSVADVPDPAVPFPPMEAELVSELPVGD